MSSSNGIISKPVSIGDIKTTLGHNSNILGDLCKSPNVNENSLIKPVQFNKRTPLTESDFLSINYGYLIPDFNTYQAMKTGVANDTKWQYLPPRGINYNEWFRTLDFTGYNQTVKYDDNKWGIQLIPPQYVKGENIKISCDFGNASGLVCPKNMEIFKNSYFAISIFGGQTNSIATIEHRWSQCGVNKIGSNSGELITVSTTDYNPTDDTLLIVPFISSTNFGKGNYQMVTGTGKKYGINYKEPQRIWISNIQMNQYDLVTGTISKSGSYGVRVVAYVKKNYTPDVIINALYAQHELYDQIDGKGNKIFTNFGKYDETTYKYTTPITVSNSISQQLPPADLGWGNSYPAAKSIVVRLEDPYYHYIWEVGTLNL